MKKVKGLSTSWQSQQQPRGCEASAGGRWQSLSAGQGSDLLGDHRVKLRKQ